MTEPAPLPRIAAVAGVVAAGVLPLGIVLATPLLASPYPGLVLFLSGLGTFALAYRWRLHRETSFLAVWVGVGLVLAVVSIVTGRWNGLTDEPYGTPAFAGLWPNLYGSPLHLVYHQYGSGPYDLVSYYVYLPLLAFVQVPSLDYRWVALGAWALAVWFVRRSGAAVTLLAAPWVALLAASGFNDFVPLAALSAAFAGLAGWRSRVAEVVSLALKQFANVIVVAYHLWRREWREALLAGAITALILAPFAYWSPSGVWCHAVLLTTGPGCSGSSGFSSAVSLVGHLNYLLWPTWLLAVFGARYVTRVRAPASAALRAEAAAAVDGLGRSSASASAPEALVVLAAPYVELRAAVRAVHPELWTVGKYCTVGATGVGVNLAVFTAVREVLGPATLLALVASAAAFCVATSWNFAGNYLWTFHDRHSRPVWHHGVGFAAASIAALSVNLVVLYLLQSSVSALWAQFLGILAGTGFSFALNRGMNFSARHAAEPSS